MLYYTYNNGRGKILEGTWHVGEKCVISHNLPVVSVQADGHELEHLCKVWGSRLPIPNHLQVVRWNDPWATLIMLNL